MVLGIWMGEMLLVLGALTIKTSVLPLLCQSLRVGIEASLVIVPLSSVTCLTLGHP